MNRYFNFCCLLYAFLLSISVLNAQENFVTGYIISLEGDSIRGYIDYKNWNRNPSSIKFKTQSSSEVINIKPKDIEEFGVKDDKYISEIVEYETSPIQTNLLEENSNLNLELDTVFLQVLISGKKELYSYRIINNRENYYIKTGNGLELLVYKKYLKDKLGIKSITENRKYIGQLFQYLEDCESISSDFKDIAYSQKSLVKIFNSYYKCKEANNIYQKEEEKSKIEFGPLIGFLFTKLSYSGSSFTFLTDAESSFSNSLSYGVFFDLLFPRNHNRISLLNEMQVLSYKGVFTFEDFINEDNFTKVDSEIDLTYLKINSLIRYRVSIKKNTGYVNVGMTNGFVLKSTTNKREVRKIFGQEMIREEAALPEIKNYELGVVVGLGYKLRKFSFELRHERGTGNSPYLALGSSSKTWSVLAGYKI